MDKENEKNYISNEALPTDFDLEDILAEYKDMPAGDSKPDSLSDRSMRLVMETLDESLDMGDLEAIGSIVESTVAEHAAAAAETPAPEPAEAPVPEKSQESAGETAEMTETERELSEYELRELLDSDEKEAYAAADAVQEEAEPVSGEKQPADTKAMKERVFNPLLSLMALVAMRYGQIRSAERHKPTRDADADAEIPEMEPEKAAKFYASQMGSLRLRGRIAVGLCLVMVYLSFAYYSPALPLLGMLHDNVRALSLVLFIFEIAVIMAGLDVFTGGLMGIVRKRMGAESLIAVSCVLSLLDALLLAVREDSLLGLPFCTVSAVSLTFAIWGSFYTCRGMRTGFRVLKASKNLYTVTGERGITPDSVALLKSRESTYGFVSRSEEADVGEYAYGVMTPFLLIAAVVLGLLAGIVSGHPEAIFHSISILVAVSATFSCTICFALPFATLARRLYQSGAAVAGWSGIRDIGRSRHVVITDSDVFPKGTVQLGGIRILEGAFTDKVISYTASVIAASGSGLAIPFADLVRRNGYSINRVENFEPHDGGGMTAMVNGESVYVGNAGFMNLMGIRVPQKLNTRSSVYTAVNGALVGIFTVEYKATGSVQDALVLLLHSNLEPVFAIRDFNITPMMIKSKFKMPTDSFKFPAYAERFRISGATPDDDSRVAAVIAREGMGPLVEVADRGRRAFMGAQISTAVSVIGSIFGLIMMFLLCASASFDSATVSNVLIFMLLWLIPEAVIVFGLQR